MKSFSQEVKSTLQITNPDQKTVWNIPDKISLKWETEHIGADKSIRFFLVRNEMVVQELGSFKNTGSTNGIELAKNIGSGDKYQVVGIELFPDNKYQIAKSITPFFSIANKASDERKKAHALAEASKASNSSMKKKSKRKKAHALAEASKASNSSIKKKSKRKKVKREKDGVAVISNTAIEESTPNARQEFEGRKISYTKELSFDNEEITVKIWDHGRQDGDIVSIYLNGNSVVNKHYLTYWKREFKIVLDKNKSNDLFLYAHNLGNSPPNTVAIEISDGNKSENIVLNSDLKSCEAVMISVNK